jgi:pantothenate kinase
MTAYIADPISSLLSLIPPVGGERIVVGLVGLPGAGKSTQAHLWSDQVNEKAHARVMQSVGMDGFHLSLSELAKLPPPINDLSRRGAPWTFDSRKLALSLEELHQHDASGNHKEVHWPGFDHGVGDPVPNAILIESSARLILVEGLYLLLPEPEWNLRNCFDHVWFLGEDMKTAMKRLVIRHCQSWGMTEAQAKARIGVNDKLNAEIVDQTRFYAQALVSPLAIDIDTKSPSGSLKQKINQSKSVVNKKIALHSSNE